MARAEAVLQYTEDGSKVMLPMRIDYFFNSKAVSDFNRTAMIDGVEASVEMIAKGVNFEKPLDSFNEPYMIFGDHKIRILKTIPVAGIGGKVTTFIGNRSRGGQK